MDNNTESVINEFIGALLIAFIIFSIVKCIKNDNEADVEKYRIEMGAASNEAAE